jgi:hypothetical protein
MGSLVCCLQISLSLRSWLVESKAICDDYEAKGELLAKVKEMVGFLLGPISVGHLPMRSRVQQFHSFSIFLIRVADDLNFAIELSKGVNLISFLGLSPMMKHERVLSCRVVESMPDPPVNGFLVIPLLLH